MVIAIVRLRTISLLANGRYQIERSNREPVIRLYQFVIFSYFSWKLFLFLDFGTSEPRIFAVMTLKMLMKPFFRNRETSKITGGWNLAEIEIFWAMKPSPYDAPDELGSFGDALDNEISVSNTSLNFGHKFSWKYLNNWAKKIFFFIQFLT